MAKEKFERKKPHVDHDKTGSTAAITTIMARKYGGEAKAYDQIDATPEEREQVITLDQSLFLDELYKRKHENINDLLSVNEMSKELPQNKTEKKWFEGCDGGFLSSGGRDYYVHFPRYSEYSDMREVIAKNNSGFINNSPSTATNTSSFFNNTQIDSKEEATHPEELSF